ncbi:MAG: hypothetical protein HC903_06065 [Methylacidiphilales bacterium]|nr:hypothetical protein [Candidatus Methylacidiphilales bacterium]
MTLTQENPPSVSLSGISFIKETWVKANLPTTVGDIISIHLSTNNNLVLATKNKFGNIKMMELGMRSRFLRMLAIFPNT